MGMRGKAVVVFLLFLPAYVLPAKAGSHAVLLGAQRRDLPDEEPFFNAVRENMVRANRDQFRYAYKERRTELHTNPFGRLGTGDVLLYEVTPGPSPSVTFRTLLAKNGEPVPNSKPEKQERRVRTDG